MFKNEAENFSFLWDQHNDVVLIVSPVITAYER